MKTVVVSSDLVSGSGRVSTKRSSFSASPKYSTSNKKQKQGHCMFDEFDMKGKLFEVRNELLDIKNKADKAVGKEEKQLHEERVKELKSFVDALEIELPRMREAKTKDNSVSPSQLNPETINNARGAFKIHNRDSGVARHRLFCKLVQAMSKNTPQEMQKTMCSSTRLEGIEGTCLLNFSSMAHSRWEWLAKSMCAVRNKHAKADHSSPIEGREVHCSELLTRCLNQFCRQHARQLPFQFSHQFSCGFNKSGKDDTVDIAVFWNEDEQNVLHDMLFGFMEVKKGDAGGDAKWQLGGHMSEAFESSLIENGTRVSFGLTVDHNYIQLCGHTWNSHDGMDRPLLEHSLLWQESIGDVGCTKLLQAHFLCLATLTDSNAQQQRARDDFCPGISEKVTRIHPKVFRGATSCFKLFGHRKHREAC